MSQKDENHRNKFITYRARAMIMSIEKESLLNIEKDTENKITKTKKMWVHLFLVKKRVFGPFFL
jgi:hypothetical protein